MIDHNNSSLFGVPYLPHLDLSLSDFSRKAQQMAGTLSISGVQPKLSLRLNKKNKSFDVVSEDGEYIIKPQVATFPNLPQNEHVCMTIANNIGISVPPHTLLKLKDDSWSYIIKRFDRNKGRKIHQEDFFQILNKKDKYKGSFEEIGRKLVEVSEFPGLDIQYLYERIVFFFIIGNGDAHLKNFSILYNLDGSIRLSPAYDIVSSKLVIHDEEDSALTINGKRNKLSKTDFLKFAQYFNITPRIQENLFSAKKPLIIDLIEKSFLNHTEKQRLTEIVNERFARLDIF